jgi:hypothetical protein
MTANKKYQVFVSSTYLDLQAERQAAVEAILKAGHIPAGMELFAAGDESQMETIKRWIEASDIYMLILGCRYGSIEPKSGMSYIEHEYDFALTIEKPIFAVVLDEELIGTRRAELDAKLAKGINPDKYSAFREKVLSKTSTFFRDPKDIKLAIHESIIDINTRYSLKGWISALELSDNKSLVIEIGTLQGEVETLKNENAKLKKQLSNPAFANTEFNQEYEDTLATLGGIQLTDIVLDPENQTPKSASLLKTFYEMKEMLALGIFGPKDNDELGKFIFLKVCPRLKIFGLVKITPITGSQSQCVLTPKGEQLLVYYEKRLIIKATGK